MESPESLLVVDDDEANRDLISRRLKHKGYSVTVAEDGGRALALIAERGFDLVLLDVMMPGLSGLEVLEVIRKSHAATELPVIMATAKTQSEDIVEALELGASDYVTKPLDFAVVLARVQTQLSLKRAIEQIRELERSLAERNRELEALNARLNDANRRMTRDLEAAAKIQAALLPGVSPSVPRAEFCWAFRPCDELAGDGLGVVRLDATRVGLYVLDVCGHGVASALLSVSVARVLTPPADPASILVRLDGEGANPRPATPAEVAARLNLMFPFDSATEQYFTIAYGVLDASTGEFRFVSAGHPGPIHVPSAGEPRVLEARGFPIGLAEGAYDEHFVVLGARDRVFFYSDGVSEAMAPGGASFGAERLVESIEHGRHVSLPDAVAALRAGVESWCGKAGVRDDVTILAAEFAGEPGPLKT
jgi:sigma-B regulation protein RsbU (phosphoserine phosphatase)